MSKTSVSEYNVSPTNTGAGILISSHPKLAIAIANLGWEEIKIPAPVFVGDTLYSETEVLDKRESKSRPTQGIVKVRHIGKNQDKVVVMDMVRSFLVATRKDLTISMTTTLS